MNPAVTFVDFFDARDFAAKFVKGFPAWLVVSFGEDFHAVRVCPGGDFVDAVGQPTKEVPVPFRDSTEPAVNKRSESGR